MKILLSVVGVLFLLFGLIALVATKSDIQIIIAVLCFGFGFMLWGQAATVEQLQRLRQ